MIRRTERLAAPGILALAAMLIAPAALAQPLYEGVDELPQIELRMTETAGPSQLSAEAPRRFVEFIEARSEGKIKIEVFWANALMTPTESAEGIGSGTADIGMAYAHFRPSDFPVANWVQIIGVESDGGNPYASMLAQGAISEFFATSDDIKREFAERNLYLLGGSGAGAYDILCTSPVATLADAAGKRTRTGTTTLAKEAAAIGMVATPLDIMEAYEAFSRGIIDCGNMEPQSYITTGMVDVARDVYWTPVELTGLALPGLAVNLDKWNSLPPVAQHIIQDAYGIYSQAIVEQRMTILRQFGELIRAGKVNAVQPSEELQAAVDAFEAGFLADMINTAPPGIENPQAVIDRLKSLFAKWDRIVQADLGVSRSPKQVDAIVDSWFADYDYAAYGQRFAAEIAASQRQ